MYYVLSVLRTIACYALKFPSIQNSVRKKAFPFTQHISKFLFCISEGCQELFGNQRGSPRGGGVCVPVFPSKF